jgi:hypothetical protein
MKDTTDIVRRDFKHQSREGMTTEIILHSMYGTYVVQTFVDYETVDVFETDVLITAHSAFDIEVKDYCVLNLGLRYGSGS